MTKEQWKAIYDFCQENAFERPSEVLQTLKIEGSIERTDTLDDLGDYDESGTYDGMIKFLTENLLWSV